jgi:mRNA interferase MazF
MEKFVKGDIVVIPFPYSDLSNSKRRPALVLSNLKGDDIILCQITSKSIKDNYAIRLNDSSFEKGSLNQISNIRPNRIFTADKHIIVRNIGRINKDIYQKVSNKIADLISL